MKRILLVPLTALLLSSCAYTKTEIDTKFKYILKGIEQLEKTDLTLSQLACVDAKDLKEFQKRYCSPNVVPTPQAKK